MSWTDNHIEMRRPNQFLKEVLLSEPVIHGYESLLNVIKVDKKTN